MMVKDPGEWLRQAAYDYETAQAMHASGRYFYAVFMCHLAVEKALKGLVQRRTGEIPPKSHNLIYLLNLGGAAAPEPIGRFLVTLNEASIATRYPEDLGRMQADFTAAVADEILQRTREVLEWIGKPS